MTLIYWKGKKFWLGKLLEHPEIMTQGETFEELEENIKDAYLMIQKVFGLAVTICMNETPNIRIHLEAQSQAVFRF